MATRLGGESFGEGSSDSNLHDLVAFYVLWIILKELPGMFGRINEELIYTFDKRYADTQTTSRVGQTRTGDITYCDFFACQPPLFEGRKDLIVSMLWIANVESNFCTCFFPKDGNVWFVVNILRGRARD